MSFQNHKQSNYATTAVVEECVAITLAIGLSFLGYAILGYVVRLWLALGYINQATPLDTELSRLVQDALLGIMSLVAFGLIPALWFIVYFLHDCWLAGKKKSETT